MSLRFRARAIFAAVLLWPLLAGASFGADRLGTAGPIRSAGWISCDASSSRREECDIPAIGSELAPEQRAQRRVDNARRLVATLRIAQAIHELDEAIAEDGRNLPALLLRARLKMDGRSSEALADLDRLLQRDPSNPDALATRAYLLQGRDDEAALRDANAAIAAGPDDADALWIRACILVQSGHLDQAEADLDRAIAVEPDDTRTLLTRAQLRMALGKSAEAIADASAVLAVRPRDWQALQIRAVSRARSGDQAQAMADLNAILGEPGTATVHSGLPRPEFVELFIQRAILLTRSGRTAEARLDLQSILASGGRPAILQLQVYLRGHGFPDVSVNGKRSGEFDQALEACFLNEACGRGIAIRG